MKAIILAAGRGRRLMHLGHELPKCLVPIDGVPVIVRLIQSIEHSHAVDEIVVVGGYRLDQLKRALPANVTVLVNSDYESTNSIVSLKIALDYLPESDLAIFNSDVVYSESLLVRYLRHPQTTSCLADETSPYELGETYLRMTNGLVEAIQEDMDPDTVSGRVAQAFRIGSDLISHIRDDIQYIAETQGYGGYAGLVMNRLCSRAPVHPVFTSGDFWREFDTPEEYNLLSTEINRDLLKGHELASYGLTDAGGRGDDHHDSEHNTSSLPERLRNGVNRTWNCFREVRFPSKMDRLFDVFKGFQTKPVHAIKYAWPLLSRQISRKAFRLQLYGAEMLSALMQESKALQIRPFLVFGSLLGSERENAFLVNDEDLDLGLLDDEFEKVDELKRRMALRGYSVRRQDCDKISFLHPNAAGLHVDIDRFYEARGCIWNTNETASDCIVYHLYFHRNTFAPLSKRRFEGTEVYVPGDPDHFLRQVYGNWRIPQKKHDVRRGPLNRCISLKNEQIRAHVSEILMA